MRQRLSALGMLMALVAACSGGGATAVPSSSAAPASVPAPGAEQRIEVRATDTFRFEPDAFTVMAGQPVTFVVTNVGAIPHEFVVGDAAVQEEHEREMAGGGMAHDEADAVSLAAGETKELVITFDAAGQLLAGCHIPGHYAAGMKATLTVE